MNQSRALFYCQPVGTHPEVANLVVKRAEEVLSKFPFPNAPDLSETSLIVAGHGTERDENSRMTLERVIERLQRTRTYADVHAVYLEEAPRIAACYELAHARNIVVVPFFAGEGPHVKHDIPVALGATERTERTRLQAGLPPWRNPTEMRGKRVWYALPVGTHGSMADVVFERVGEAVRTANPNPESEANPNSEIPAIQKS